jgi:methyl-accepting chemotaxis protein
MDESSGAERRAFFKRRYLVDRRFQFKYTFLILAISSAIYAFFGYQLYRGELARTEILKIQNSDVAALVSSQDTAVLAYLIGFFLLQAASLIVLGILITHRIAGPVYRVQRYLEEAAKGGELKPLDGIRSRDEFHGFFDALSAFVERFRK